MEPHGCDSAKLRSIYAPICSNMFRAAKTGNVNLLKYCVDHEKQRFDIRDPKFDRTLAHLGAINGHLNVVQWCVSKNKNFFIDSVDGLNDTLLIAAAKGGNVQVVDYVADKNTALVHRMSGADHTALHVAAIRGHKKVVARLVDRWGMLINETTLRDHYTAAHLAAKSSHIPVLNWLLERDESLAHAIGTCDYDLLYWTVHSRLRNVTRNLCEKYHVRYRKNCDGDYPIHVAFRMGSFRTAEVLGGVCGANVLEKQTVPPYNTVAHEAAQNGHVEALKQLDWLNKTYNDVTNVLGQTPIMLAVEQSQFPAVRYLVRKGAPLKLKDQKGDTVLHYAACKQHLSILKALWKKRNEVIVLVNNTNAMGQTSVYKAAECENLRFIEYMVEQGADLNVPTLEYRTPLSIAIERDDLKLVEYLIKKPIVADLLDIHGLKAWDYAWSQEMKELIRPFTSTATSTNSSSGTKHNCTLILDAARDGDLERINFCVVRQDPKLVNMRSIKNESLAHVAAINGHFELIQWLLQYKKQFIFEYDSMKNTLLHAAAEGGSVEMVDFVLSRRMSLRNRKNVRGFTALHVAVAHGHEEVVVGLVEDWGMWPSDTILTGNTSPLVAAEHKKFHLVEWFLENDSSLADAVGECERSLLHWTALWDNATMTELLCRKYKVTSGSDCEGDFPIHIAFRNSNYAVADVLYKMCNANPLQPKWRFPNNTAAHEAAQKGNLDTFEFFDSNDLTRDYLELKNDLLQPPVFRAAHGNQFDAFDFLINAKKVALHWKDLNGNTILHMLACNSRIEVFQYLELERPYQISSMLNETNKAGETLLYKATECNNLPLVQYLMRFLRPDTQKTAVDNTTALFVAIRNHNHDMVELLAPSGYEKRLINGVEKEIWDYAQTEEMKELVQNNLFCPIVRDYIPPQMPEGYVSVERHRRMVDETDYLGAGNSTQSLLPTFFPNTGVFSGTLLLLGTMLNKVLGWKLRSGSMAPGPISSPPEAIRREIDPLAIEAIYRSDYLRGLDDLDDDRDNDGESTD